jgi:hypothetical protein
MDDVGGRNDLEFRIVHLNLSSLGILSSIRLVEPTLVVWTLGLPLRLLGCGPSPCP